MLQPRQRSLPVQVYAIVNLVLFFICLATGQMALAWALALIGLGLVAYPRLTG